MEPAYKISDIYKHLRTYEQYKNLSDYYIKKDIKEKYKLKTVKKENLLEELNYLYNAVPSNVILPSEMWENILLNTDVNELKNVCFTNKTTINICNKTSFWKEKITLFNLPFDWLDLNAIKSINDWIKTFDKLLFSDLYSTKLLLLLDYL